MLATNVSFSEMSKCLTDVSIESSNKFKVLILRNIMLEPITVPLKYFAKQAGFDADIQIGNFDSIIPDSSDAKLISKELDLIVIAAPLQALSPNLSDKFLQLSPEEIQQEVDLINQFYQIVFNNIRKLNAQVPILVLGFEQPYLANFGVFEVNFQNSQTSLVCELRNCMTKFISQQHNAYTVDTDLILRKLGSEKLYDMRYWHIGRALYSREGLIEIAYHIQMTFNSLCGKSKKCLILDCDNTLWGGIVGEDGLEGIKIDAHYPGSCYLALQQVVVSLYHQGILIALCSKNNEQDVLEVFDSKSEMLLKRKHISCHRINWQDKASNIVEIAKQLNIGIDSVVFVDDNPFEIASVNTRLPEVETVLLDNKAPTQHAEKLKSLYCFSKETITKEDQHRTKMIQQQAQRAVLSEQLSHSDYLKSLDIKLSVFIANNKELIRLSQQTQKTNQFNLTTKRYSYDDLLVMQQSKEYEVIGLRVTDRFGDMGIVGTAILQYQVDSVFIDSFLLSCRALGRDIEQTFLKEIINFCQTKAYFKIIGTYQPTAKNHQVADFYPNNHFSLTNSDKGVNTFELIFDDTLILPKSTYQTDNSRL